MVGGWPLHPLLPRWPRYIDRQSCSPNLKVNCNHFPLLGGNIQPWSWQLLPPVYGLVVSSLLDLLDKLRKYSKFYFNKFPGITRRGTMESTGLRLSQSHQSLSKVILTTPCPAKVLPGLGKLGRNCPWLGCDYIIVLPGLEKVGRNCPVCQKKRKGETVLSRWDPSD